MADVYTLKITYQGCDERIWREVQISSNAFLADLGYTVLVTFDTLAYHLFKITYNDTSYELPNEDEIVKLDKCLFCVKLRQLNAKEGDHLTMVYDFGIEQVFDIEITNIRPMARGAGTAYPKVISGAGKGILDDISSDELMEIIDDTDKNGSSAYTYFSRYGFEEIWDYRDYDIKFDNLMLKGEIGRLREAYSAFEAYLDEF